MQLLHFTARNGVSRGGHRTGDVVAKGHHLIESAAIWLAGDDPGLLADQISQRVAVPKGRHGGKAIVTVAMHASVFQKRLDLIKLRPNLRHQRAGHGAAAERGDETGDEKKAGGDLHDGMMDHSSLTLCCQRHSHRLSCVRWPMMRKLLKGVPPQSGWMLTCKPAFSSTC